MVETPERTLHTRFIARYNWRRSIDCSSRDRSMSKSAGSTPIETWLLPHPIWVNEESMSLGVGQGRLVSLNTMIFYMESTKERDIFCIGIVTTFDLSVLRSQ